jgi:nitroreductase
MAVSYSLSARAARQLKRAPAGDGILPVVLERWSPLSFDSREVKPDDLKRVFEAARWAPSSYNEQPWRFIVGQHGSDTFQRIVSTLTAGNQAWATRAPALILSVAKRTFSRNNAPNHHALFDLGAASAMITLQATALGLATHQMAGFDHDVARKILEIPEDCAMGSVMALGYQADPSALPNEKLIASETGQRTRKSLREVVFSTWGQPAKLE